ncbi:DNRLRE domain-containing protein [Nonomuraea sp. NPDC052129]|uniref:DNRLRE domain-containing protein n=1 Tax=Nonomuraea sp. NPDC052129 TaxID=3154651 RepID=UPI00343099BF
MKDLATHGPPSKNASPGRLSTTGENCFKQGGSWHPVDTTLVADNGVIRPRSTRAGLTLSPGGDTELLTAGSGRDGSTIKVSAPRSLAVPKLSGNRAEYADAYGPGVDLVVVATPTGFREEVVIRRRPSGPLAFSVPVQLPDGFSLGKSSAGKLVVRDGAAHTTTELPPPMLTDASADLSVGEEGHLGKVAMTVGKAAIVYKPDAGFFGNSRVSYPLSLVVADSDWTELPVGNDTFINNSSYQNGYANSGAYHLQAGKTNEGTVRWRTYIRFEEIPEDSPLRGGRVTNADLVLWNIASNDCGVSVGSGITARRVTQRWDVSTLTWSNQPTVTGDGANTEYGAYLPGCDRGYMDYEWDLYHSVNAITQAWADGQANYGFQLTSGNESDYLNWRAYRSKEYVSGGGAHGPKLVIGYVPAPPKNPNHITLLEEGEQVPTTLADLDALAAQSRVAKSLIGMPQLSDDEIVDIRNDADADEALVPTEELDEPVPGLPEPEHGLTGHWTFDEGSGDRAADSSGNLRTATLNTTAAWTPGRTGSALTNQSTPPGLTRQLSPWIGNSRAAAGPVLSGFDVQPSQKVNGTIVTPSLTPSLRALVTDPGRAASKVDFQIMRYVDDAPVWSGSLASVPSGTQASIAVPAAKLLDGTRYEWQVRATAGGVTSAWSGYQFFTADVPEAVVDQFQVTPSSQVGTDTVTPTLTPTLKARVTDPLGGPVGVAFEVKRYTDDVSVWSGSVANVASGSLASVTVPAGKLVNGVKYEWQVKATTPGSTPAWTGYQFFSVDATPSVDQFQLTPSQLVGGAITTTSLTPTMLARATNPTGGTLTAEFRVLKYADDSMVWSGSVTAVPSGTQASITVPAAKLLDGTRYEWQVRATAGGVTSAWSGYQFFTVDVPEAVVDQFQVTPSSLVGAEIVTPSQTPALKVRVTDPLGRAATVDFEVRDYATDTLQWSTSVPSAPSGAEASASVPPNKLADGVKYEWRVKASTPGSTPSWTGYQFFTVDVPEATVGEFQVTPAETIDANTVTPSLTPSLLVRVTDPLGGAVTVDFEVADYMTDTVLWTASSAGVASGTTATVKIPTGVLSDQHDYEFRAKATTRGSTASWSSWQRFQINVFNPDTDPALGSPQVVPSQVDNGTAVTSTVSPELRVTVTTPQEHTSRVEFELEHDPSAPEGQGSGQIWATALDQVVSGATAAVQVPADKLHDGWVTRWRVRSLDGGASSTWTAWQRLAVTIPKPGVTFPQVTPSSVIDGKLTTTSLTPALEAVLTYGPGGTLRAEYEIEHDPDAPQGQGSGLIWSGAVGGVQAGARAGVNVEPGKLTDGWHVRWRVRSITESGTAPLTSAWTDWQSLIVDLPDSAPAVEELQVTPSSSVDGKTITPTVTPQLRATAFDPRGEPVRAEFELEHDPSAPGEQGSGQIWASGVDNVRPGTQATVAVPGGKLSDGWMTRWRARAVSASASSAWSDWQQLTVRRPASAPTVGEFRVVPSAEVGGQTVTPSLTPQLLVTAADPRGDLLSAEFEVEHDPSAPEGQGTGQIWTATVADVQAGTQATAAMPAGELSDGWVVRWRARALSSTATSAWSSWQKLTINVPKPDVSALEATPNQVVNAKRVVTSTTPTLGATVVNPDGAPVRAEVELEHDPSAPAGQGSGRIWSGSVDGAASGSRGQVTVPANLLSDGWVLRWRARAVAGESTAGWSPWQVIVIHLVQPGEEALAQTSEPVLATDHSFTVAAWVRWTARNGSYSVAEQRGAHQAPFRLGYDQEHGLVFTLTSADTADATTEGAVSGIQPPLNEWFHLAGTYEASSKTATLYLNGSPIKTAAISFPSWNAAGPLTMGTSMPGAIDELRTYSVAAAPESIAALFGGVAAPAAAKIASAAALPGRTYDRLGAKECATKYFYPENGKPRWSNGWAKNGFSLCRIFALEAKWNDRYEYEPRVKQYLNPMFTAGLMVVARTYGTKPDGLDSPSQTNRLVVFDAYVLTGKRLGPSIADEVVTIGMLPPRNSRDCLDVTQWGGAQNRNFVQKTVDQWETQNPFKTDVWTPQATFRFWSDPAAKPAERITGELDANGKAIKVENAEAVSHCGFNTYAHAEGFDILGAPYPWGLSKPVLVRCDSAAYLSGGGGCVFPAVPSLQLGMGNLATPYDQTYMHYWNACYASPTTYPRKTGKLIRGCYDYGNDRLPSPEHRLTRRPDDPDGGQNRGRAQTRCDSLWLGYKNNGRECDEYPFATTNRTVDSDKNREFSVCPVPAASNRNAGTVQNRFYQQDRVLYRDAFAVRFKQLLDGKDGRPKAFPIDTLCEPPKNPVSPYAIDKDHD